MKVHTGRIGQEHFNLAWVVLVIGLTGAGVFYFGQTCSKAPYSVSDYHGRGTPL